MRRYLTKPALVIKNYQAKAFVAPEGSVIVVPAPPLEGHRLVDVILDGQTATMFVSDLVTRAEKLPKVT
jgi:hypothetical protein